MVRDMQERWKSPERRQADTEIAAETGRILAEDDAQQVRDAAYEEYVARLTNAWRNRA